jgi:uncharacterized protein (TIGR03118 family)
VQIVNRSVWYSALIAAGLISASAARADDVLSNAGGYIVTALVSDLGDAQVQDPNLKNAWGVAFSPAASPFWIADNGTGLSTLYDGDGTIISGSAFPVIIPCPPKPGQGSSCPTNSSPTGMVWNPSSKFLVPGSTTQAAFIFASEDGTISAWAGGLTPANQAVLAVDNSVITDPQTGAVNTNGAVYKGLAVGVNVNGVFLFATNFRGGTIDVFQPAPTGSTTGFYVAAQTDGSFSDPNIPAGYAPFGIRNIDGDLFVTYAKENAQKHDDVAKLGHGFVDVYDTDGHLLRRFASRGTLNSPWGLARASYAFGKFSGKILVGNFGDGRVNVFDSGGRFVTQLTTPDGGPLAIDGLWTLTLGGGAKSSSDTLYYTAGPNGETDGQFGTITPAVNVAGQ